MVHWISDNTVLHSAWTKPGMVSLHVAMVQHLERWSPRNLDELFAHLTGCPGNYKDLSWDYQGVPISRNEAVNWWITGRNVTLLALVAAGMWL